MKAIYMACVAFIVGGCMTSHVMIGDARPAIAPDQVKIYAKAPLEYVEIALIQSSSKGSWAVSEQGKTNKTINRMKEQAAKLGANGILITGLGEGTAGGVSTYNGTGNFGAGYVAAAQYKTGQSVAIWVDEPSSR